MALEDPLKYFKKALDIHKNTNNTLGEINDLNNMGTVYSLHNKYDRAIECYQQALELNRNSINTKLKGETLGNIAVMYVQNGRYENGLQLFNEALDIFKKMFDRKSVSLTLNNIGWTKLSTGEPVKAEIHLEEAAEVFESIRGEIKTGTQRIGFQSTLPDLYANLARARLAQGRPDGAFEAIERGRAKSFLDLLGSRAAFSRQKEKKPEELLAIERQLAGLSEKRVKVALAPAGAKTRSAISAVNQQISELDKQRLELIDQIRRADPELGSLMVVEPPNLKEIQPLLAPGTALVEYFHPGKITVSGKKKDQLWIFVLLSGGLHFKSVDVSKADLRKALEEYARLVADESSDPRSVEAVSARIYRWLIEPVEPISRLANAKTLIIVPWGPMFKIPFAALVPTGGKPLGARKNVVMTPSAGVYRYLVKKRGSGRGKVFAIGNPKTAMVPLQGAEREAKEIAGLFQKSIVRTRNRATESLIKSDYDALGRPDVIHLACHGIFNERVPQLSHLALTPDQKNDGKFEMHEIFDLDWRGVSLVTLSACSSGKGKLGAGDDLVGLMRGFMFAGAPSVLSSLWDVDDEATRTLMVNFYRNYLDGMSKPESLRKAQMAMMNSGKWSHPYYWSAFVLFGDWE